MNAATRHLLFHVHTRHMNVTAARVKDAAGRDLAVTSTFNYMPNEFYVIELQGEAVAGQTLQVRRENGQYLLA